MDYCVLISAHSEWRAFKEKENVQANLSTPFGEGYLGGETDKIVYLNTGWGKTASAAATQYAIDMYRPRLLINLGTCGGLQDYVSLGDVILATETKMYDIFESMSDYAQANEYYKAVADLSWIKGELPAGLRRGWLGSADQDIRPENYLRITQEFGASVADWESAAFGWVASKNHVPWVVLRSVSDIAGAEKAEATNNVSLWKQRVPGAMQALINLLPWVISQFEENFH